MLENLENKLFPNTWIDCYADYLYNYAIVRVNNPDVAKDLVQETFLSVFLPKKLLNFIFEFFFLDSLFFVALKQIKNPCFYQRI